MSSSGKTIGIVEIVAGIIIDVVTWGSGGNELIFMGLATELAILLQPTPHPAGQDGIIRSSVANAQIVYGTIKTGGVLTFASSYGSNGSNTNAFLTCCVSHSLTRQNSAGTAGMPIKGIQGFYINDVYVPLTVGAGGGWNAGRGSASGTGACAIKQQTGAAWNNLAGNLWMSFSDGSQTTADPILETNFGPVDTNFIGYGNAYTTWVMFMSADQGTFTGAFPNGLSTPSTLGVVLDGQFLYDPRLDSNNGGTGTQSLTNTTTWGFSSNPAIVLADYLTRSKNDGGCGYAPGTYSGSSVINSQINWPAVAAAANICDENINIPAYGATWNGTTWSSTDTIAQYTFNGAINTKNNCDQNVVDIIKTMSGFITVAGNQIYMYAGAATTPETTPLDETFLAGPVSLSPTIQRSQMYNAVKMTYGQEPQQDYNQAQGMPIINSTYETQDGGVRLWYNDTIAGCNNQFSCQILERIASQKSRNKKVLKAKCNLKALIYKCGDVVNVNLGEFDLTTAPYRIMQYSMSSNYTIDMMMLEEKAGSYVLPATADGVYQPYDVANYQALYNLTPSAPQPPSAMSASPLFSGILLQWTPPPPNQYDFQTVWRSTSATPMSGYTAIGGHVVGDSFVDTNTVASTQYFYYLTATNYWSTTTTTPGSYMAQATALTTIQESAGTIHDVNIPDANFQVGTGQQMPPGWEQTTPNRCTTTFDVTSPYFGTQSLYIMSTGANQAGIQPIESYSITPGDQLSFGAVVKSYSGDNVVVGVSFYKGTTYISDDYVSTNAAPWTIISTTATAPAQATSFQIWIIQQATAANHIAFINQMWASINDPTIQGSAAQNGDARNVRAVTAAGVQYYVSGLTLTAPNPNEITATAMTLLMGGSGTGNVSYNSSLVTGLTASTTYYLYYLDPGFNGGSKTLNATTNKTNLTAYPDVVYIGYWTTPASGGGGGGGIGGCVSSNAYLATRDSSQVQAGAATKGLILNTLTDTNVSGTAPILNNPYIVNEPCVQLTTANGTLIVSDMTPVNCKAGPFPAYDTMNEQVWTSLNGGSWETITSVQYMQPGQVVRISLGGLSFGASDNPGYYIYTHNNQKP